MGRKKVEFKNLGILPQGEWQVTLAVASGVIILTYKSQEPRVISDGKLTTLVASRGGKPDAKQES